MILERSCTTTLEQLFNNPGLKDNAEAVYNFPLQSTSAVYSFVTNFLDADNNTIKLLVGKCKEKQEAREEYEEMRARDERRAYG